MSGVVSEQIMQIMTDYPFYQQYRNGQLSTSVYLACLETNETELKNKLGSGLYSRLKNIPPSSEVELTDRLLTKLKACGAIHTTDYSSKDFEAFRLRMKQVYDHQSYNTSIFPEEARIAYALSEIIAPRLLFTAGSYYGYWTAWTMPAIAKEKGRAIFSDVDLDVSKLAKQNMEALGYLPYAQVICDDAEKLLHEVDGSLDMLLIDAYGRFDDPRHTHRGKAIYDPIVQAGIDSVRSGGIILCHNIDPSSKDLAPFFLTMRNYCSRSVIAGTADGVAVYIKD